MKKILCILIILCSISPLSALQPGDIIYRIGTAGFVNTDSDTENLIGHTGIYIGNGIVIEEIEKNNVLTAQFSTFEQFLSAGQKIHNNFFTRILTEDKSKDGYYGAKHPAFLPNDEQPARHKVVEFAIKNLFKPYKLLGTHRVKGRGGTFSCVGLAEAAYEYAGYDIVRDEGLLLTPKEQYNALSMPPDFSQPKNQDNKHIIEPIINSLTEEELFRAYAVLVADNYELKKIKDNNGFYPLPSGILSKGVLDKMRSDIILEITGPAEQRKYIGKPKKISVYTENILFLVDVSASMQGWKIDKVKENISHFIDYFQLESAGVNIKRELGIITFSNNADLKMNLTSDYKQIQKQAETLQVHGATNLSDGILLAVNIMKKTNKGKSVILLSDGVPTAGLTNKQAILNGPVKQAYINKIKIYTIGIGRKKQDFDEDLLKKIASATGGKYNFASSAYKLTTGIIKARHSAAGQIITSVENTIAQSQKKTIQIFTLKQNMMNLFSSLVWPGSTLKLILTDPSGKIVDENYPDAVFNRTKISEDIIIKNPIAGDWRAVAFGEQVDTDSEPFEFIASTNKPYASPLVIPAEFAAKFKTALEQSDINYLLDSYHKDFKTSDGFDFNSIYEYYINNIYIYLNARISIEKTYMDNNENGFFILNINFPYNINMRIKYYIKKYNNEYKIYNSEII